MSLSLDAIRSIANKHGYEELSHSEDSRVVSFRGGPAKSTRINVYYTTGTVGTCLNHPKRGKTQLFRRDMSLDNLENIFENPRVHTGGGYYTRRHSILQPWKSEGNHGKSIADSANLWRYVGLATGIVKNDRELKLVMDICSLWDGLYWNEGDGPILDETNFGCGSHGGLLQMLYEVIQEGWGDFQICAQSQLQKYDRGDIEISDIDAERPYNHECPNYYQFQEVHQSDVQDIKRKFNFLRKDLRLELAQWFLSRDVAGYTFTDSNFQVLRTKYSDAIREANFEYGRLAYPKNAGLCSHCGVFYTYD